MVARRRIQSCRNEDSEMTERISLEGKVALVTGAGRGLGRAYVELLAERGARVVVNDLGTDVSGFGKDATIADEVAGLIRSRGGEAIADDSDVSTPEGGNDLIATTIEHFGRIDLLVNNAGICGSQLFEDAALDDFDHYWRVHLGGPVNTVKAADRKSTRLNSSHLGISYAVLCLKQKRHTVLRQDERTAGAGHPVWRDVDRQDGYAGGRGRPCGRARDQVCGQPTGRGGGRA